MGPSERTGEEEESDGETTVQSRGAEAPRLQRRALGSAEKVLQSYLVRAGRRKMAGGPVRAGNRVVAGRQAGRLAGWQAGRQAGRQAGGQAVGCLADRHGVLNAPQQGAVAQTISRCDKQSGSEK